MTICFISNYLTHHQLPFCLQMKKLTDNNFVFIETDELPDERVKLGYSRLGDTQDFVIRYNDDSVTSQYYIDNSDVTIYGDSKRFLIKNRLKNNKLTFRYSERFLKKLFYLCNEKK